MDVFTPQVMSSLVAFFYRLADPLPLACCLYAGYAVRSPWPALGLGVMVRLVFLGFTIFAARSKGQPFDPSALDVALAMLAGVLPVLVGRVVRKSAHKDKDAVAGDEERGGPSPGGA